MARNKGKGSKGGGSDKLKIDEKELLRLAKLKCPVSEMAILLGCHKDTLNNNFRHIIEAGYADFKMRLREQQSKKTFVDGCAKTLDKLSNVYLDQAQKVEVAHSGSVNISVNFVSDFNEISDNSEEE